jgi:hypothetical protein
MAKMKPMAIKKMPVNIPALPAPSMNAMGNRYQFNKSGSGSTLSDVQVKSKSSVPRALYENAKDFYGGSPLGASKIKSGLGKSIAKAGEGILKVAGTIPMVAQGALETAYSGVRNALGKGGYSNKRLNKGDIEYQSKKSLVRDSSIPLAQTQFND